jgi:hypothetical protein
LSVATGAVLPAPALDGRAVTDVESARLVGRAVARRGELAVRALRGHPGLDVVLAGGAGSEVSRRDVDDAVAEAEVLQHLLLQRDEAQVLRLGILGRRVDEHLELVELVHPDDAAGVLAVRAGLAAVAGRPAGVALRARGQVEDLAHVVAGERHLARADEVQVVGLELVDLVGVLPRKPVPRMTSGRTSVGGIMGMNPASTARWSASDMSAYSRRADAGEEVEAAAGDLGAALHVDRAELLAEGRWSSGSKSKDAGSPCVRTVTKFSSPPAGTPSMTMFSMRARPRRPPLRPR